MPNYVITESVGNRVERVNSYRDLEKHHPSSGREPGREYRTIDGELEEVRTRNRTEAHVKKDFIIDPPTIPAPASGTIRTLNDAWNTVQIVDDNGNVLAQSLHMARGSQPANGSRIEYGQPMGRMGDVGSPGSVHAHVEAPAAVFERYINDITSGRIQSNGAARPGATNADPMADGVLRHGERGDAVTRLQDALNKAGIRDEQGQPLPTTGYFGDKTEAAVRKYQEQKGLEVDGKAGNDTLTALGLKQAAQQPRPQTVDTQPQPQQTPQPQTPANPDAKANFAASDFLKSQTPEVRAYLDLVAWKEVHQSLNADGSPAGYRERNGVPGSRGLMAESAIADNGTLPRDELRYNVGRYQMKQVDVDDMRKRYDPKIDDFSPESQDRIAVAKMQYRGVMAPLQNGDIRTAIERGGKEWASLPGSPYGQVQAGYTADKAVDYYNERLAFHRALDKGQVPPARTENGATQGQSGGVGDTLLVKEERGEGVRRLQEALNKAGIRDDQGQPLPTTGYFGDRTEAAVRKYQEQKGLEVDGKAGENTLKSLGIFPGQEQTQTPAQPKVETPTQPQPNTPQPNTPAPTQPEQSTPQPTQPRVDTPAQPQPTQPQPNTPAQPNATIPANVAASEGILQPGSTGPDVAKLQTMLNNQGYRGPDGQPIPTNGTFDAATTHALKAFERDNGMDPNGIAGPKTLEALSKAEQSPKLSNPNHPDNALYQQAMKGLELMPAGTFKNAQERENAAATIAFEAKVSGLSQIDHVKSAGNNAGFFAVQGGLEDPTNKRVYVDREQALQQTVQQSTQLMQQNTQNQQQTPAQDTAQQRENTQRGAMLA
jgi:peptidoglycan hydrolase-like protein with peptidoglycan-binding domain